MTNSAILKRGHKKAVSAFLNYLSEVGKKFAVRALFEAVVAWDEDKDSSDLTGNTRTGFCAAVYYDGKILGEPLNVFSAGLSVGRPTHGFTYVGDTGFTTYDGDEIGREGNPFVREYNAESGLSFQKVQVGGIGYEVTSNWLKSHRPRGGGLVITVANAVPYASYLKEARKLDILESTATSGFAKYALISSFLDVRFEDYLDTGKNYG